MTDELEGLKGSFVCPICGRDTPHPHSDSEQRMWRRAEAAEAERDEALRMGAETEVLRHEQNRTSVKWMDRALVAEAKVEALVEVNDYLTKFIMANTELRLRAEAAEAEVARLTLAYDNLARSILGEKDCDCKIEMATFRDPGTRCQHCNRIIKRKT